MNYTAYASAANITHEQWLAYRRTGLGGSDAGAIMGVSPYKSAYAVWADKLGALPPTEDSEPMRQGAIWKNTSRGASARKPACACAETGRCSARSITR